ncbi:hypothetical protein HMPREF9088_0850 [Enterococcus italicus DSM 15952]|uniref:Uncharacterized protein n=1 Tax=Enterococcus italicus (strain DSM 15952 / CCUG 50447 / LMG 22039 / TP 1.5) TaxID=888064 RepID=E6LER0_ENTI1|nr:hypothetical protein HMPREF9088_0850 [Enterococcus italicus DSM 15952]
MLVFFYSTVIAAIKRDKLNDKKARKAKSLKKSFWIFWFLLSAEPFCLSLYVY